jgi:hypothetical protein
MLTGFQKKNTAKKLGLPNLDSQNIISEFQQYFTGVKDPRVERKKLHLLSDIISIAVLAVIAGAEG